LGNSFARGRRYGKMSSCGLSYFMTIYVSTSQCCRTSCYSKGAIHPIWDIVLTMVLA